MLIAKKVVAGILDSGATVCICGVITLFKNLRPCYVCVMCANKDTMVCKQMGTIVISHMGNVVVIDDCLYIPGCMTLISANQLTSKGMILLLYNAGAHLFKSFADVRADRPFIKSEKRITDKLWTLPIKSLAPYDATTAEETEKSKASFAAFMDSVLAEESIMAAHEAHAHAPLSVLKLLYPHYTNVTTLPVCDGCLSQSVRNSYAKKYKEDYLIRKDDRQLYKITSNIENRPSTPAVTDPHAFNTLSNPMSGESVLASVSDNRSDDSTHTECKIDDPNLVLLPGPKHDAEPGSNTDTMCLALHSHDQVNAGIEDAPITHRFGRSLHSDTKYVSTESVRGYRYLFIVVDKDTRVTFGFLGVSKSDFEPIAKHWLRKFYNIYQRYPEWWKFDQGGEFLNGELAAELSKRNITFVFATTNAHNQNAYSERKIGVVWNAVLKTLATSAVPMQFWCFCAIYMIFVQNHLPHRGISNDIPLSRAKMTTNYQHIHPFGCEVWFVVEPETGSSESRCKRGVFLGVSDMKLGYDILDIESRKVIQSRNVHFVDTRKPFLIAQKPCKIHLDFGTWPSPNSVAKVSLPEVPFEVRNRENRESEERGGIQVIPVVPTIPDIVPRIQGPPQTISGPSESPIPSLPHVDDREPDTEVKDPHSNDTIVGTPERTLSPILESTPNKERTLSPILESTPNKADSSDWDEKTFELSPEPWGRRTPSLPSVKELPDAKHIETGDMDTESNTNTPAESSNTEDSITPSSIDNPMSKILTNHGNTNSGGAETPITPGDTEANVSSRNDFPDTFTLAKGSLKPLNLAPKRKSIKASAKITTSETTGMKEKYLFDLDDRNPTPTRFESDSYPPMERQYEIERIIERKDNEGKKGADKHSYLIKWADCDGISYPEPVWVYGGNLNPATRNWYNKTYHPKAAIKKLRPSKVPVVSDRERSQLGSMSLRNRKVKSMNERDMINANKDINYANIIKASTVESHTYFGRIPGPSNTSDRIIAEDKFAEWGIPNPEIDKSSVDAPTPIDPIEKVLHLAYDTITEINSDTHRSKTPKGKEIYRDKGVVIKDITESERILSETALRLSKTKATQVLYDGESFLEDVLFTHDYVNTDFGNSEGEGTIPVDDTLEESANVFLTTQRDASNPKCYDGQQPEVRPTHRIKTKYVPEMESNRRIEREPIPLPPRRNIVPVSDDNVSLEKLLKMSERNFSNILEELKVEACNSLNEVGKNEVSKEELTMEAAASQRQAYSSPYKDEYIEAEHRELKGLHLHGTFEEVYCPQDRTPITCRWVYDLKRDKEGRINLFKARLVVHGFKQVAGIDFNKTFSSTAQLRTFRFVVAIAVARGYKMTQYDISQAFLNGELEEEIYMNFPPGYPSKHTGTVLKLVKGLYGLKQASRLWQKTLYKALGDLGLVQCKTESGVLRWEGKDKVCLVVCWVDDLIIVCEDERLRKQIEDKLKKEFLVKMMGQLEMYVGIIFEYDKDGNVILHQGPYNRKVYEKFEVDRKFHANVPAQSDRLSKVDCPINEEEIAEASKYPYMSVTGSLLYSAICTRPDIFYAVMQLARFNSNPGKPHIKASEQCLRYLQETSDMGIKYTVPKDKKAKIVIHAFVDSDWGGCPDTRRSTSGYVIHVCGGPVAWRSKLMPTIALSSCEAEFMALTEVCRELMWMCRFMDEIGIDYEVPNVYCDSSSAINWAEDPVQHQRNKHVEIKYLYCRDVVSDEKVRLFKVHTSRNIADLMTKPVGRQNLEAQRPVMMGHKPPIFD